MKAQKPFISKEVLTFGFCRLEELLSSYDQNIKLPDEDVQIGRLLRGAVAKLPDNIKLCFGKFLKNKNSDRRFVAMCLLLTFDGITKHIKTACDIHDEGLTTRQIATIFSEDTEKSDLYTAAAINDFFKSDKKERKISKKYFDETLKSGIFTTAKSVGQTYIWKVIESTKEEVLGGSVKTIIIIGNENYFKLVTEVSKVKLLIKFPGSDLFYINQNNYNTIEIIVLTGTVTYHSRYLVDPNGSLAESFWFQEMTTA